MKKIAVYILLFSLLIGCASAKKRIQKSTSKVFTSTFYENQFTGFLVVNAQTKDTLLDFNDEKYFTPASNTKIFTLFTSLSLLADRIPALKYITANDTLFIEGTGDPTFLHTYFENNKTLDFLKQQDKIALYFNNYQDKKYGPGWAWDDYSYYYQPEIGSFPMYGNVATLWNAKGTNSTPTYFTDSIVPIRYKTLRELEQNRFYFAPSSRDTLEIPFRTYPTLTKNLLELELNKKVAIVQKMPLGEKNILYSVPTDTVLKRMMIESDNFLAEQLLILGASTLSDTLKASVARDHVLENRLADLKHMPRWVDGSGLSRYNLFTPSSMVQVLEKLYTTVPRERLFSFFPAGGVTGTLENWYAGDPNPYVYAKSGSLGNVYCLSGYLITKSGETLIFSFMNNHFRHSTSEIKKQMERIFEEIRDTY